MACSPCGTRSRHNRDAALCKATLLKCGCSRKLGASRGPGTKQGGQCTASPTPPPAMKRRDVRRKVTVFRISALKPESEACTRTSQHQRTRALTGNDDRKKETSQHQHRSGAQLDEAVQVQRETGSRTSPHTQDPAWG